MITISAIQMYIPQDLFYDYRRNCGYLVNKLKNSNAKRARQRRNSTEPQSKKLSSSNPRAQEVEIGIGIDEDLNYLLKITPTYNDTYDEEVMGQIQSKLIPTFQRRRSLMKSTKSRYKDFPYLFLSTEIVRKTFAHHITIVCLNMFKISSSRSTLNSKLSTRVNRRT